jgi:hypothetical protein
LVIRIKDNPRENERLYWLSGSTSTHLITHIAQPLPWQLDGAKSLFGGWLLNIKHVAGGPENAILSSGGLDFLVA